MNNIKVIVVFVLMISLLFLFRVESFLLSSSLMKRREQYKLYAEDSTRGGGAGVVEQRKVETGDSIENKTQGKNKRLSSGSGSDERVIDNGESNIHRQLLKIMKSFQQQQLLMSLKQDNLNYNDKLLMISHASKDDIIDNSVAISGILNDDKAINSFHLGAAGLFDEWNE